MLPIPPRSVNSPPYIPCRQLTSGIFQAWSGLDPDGRVEPGDPAWEALAAYRLAGIRSGQIRPDDWVFDVYLRLLRERL